LYNKQIEIMKTELKKGDTLNIIGCSLHVVERVTDKAVLIDWGTSNDYKKVSKWIPKSVLNILNVEPVLTSNTGIVYRVDKLPYFITK